MNMKLNALKTTIRTTALALAGAALLVGFNPPCFPRSRRKQP